MSLSLSRRHLLATAAASFLASRMAIAGERVQISGGGSGFIDPVMQRWAELCPAKLGADVTYTPIGAGAAQSKILSGELDFAASELPLSASILENSDLMQFPVAFGALACVVNIPGLARDQLRLSATLLAAIYTGGIKKWNDPKILAANPGLGLPEMDIIPVRLDTPSGKVFSTTAAFTQYLLATNADWREKYGATVGKRWAVGMMANSSENLVETMKAMSGTIGYVPLGTAIAEELTTVMLWNKAGKPLSPSLAALRAAVDQADWSKADTAPSLIDQPGDAAWPIVLTTYVMMPRHPKDQSHSVALRAFIKFIITEGHEGATQRHAVALPPAQQAAILGWSGLLG